MRDSGFAFTKNMPKYNMSYFHFANKFRNKGDVSKSIICSSISSRVSTESYLFQKNSNLGTHAGPEVKGKNEKNMSFLGNLSSVSKQSSLKS